jgi:hypothetical protein
MGQCKKSYLGLGEIRGRRLDEISFIHLRPLYKFQPDFSTVIVRLS